MTFAVVSVVNATSVVVVVDVVGDVGIVIVAVDVVAGGDGANWRSNEMVVVVVDAFE